MTRREKHEFALYYPHFLSNIVVNETIFINQLDIVNRMVGILRLKEGESCILFDRSRHVIAIIIKVSKKSVEVQIQSIGVRKSFVPDVTVLLPLLKREALEFAMYTATVLGINTIQLVKTEKSGLWGGKKEYARLERIMIAAAEQSKQFFLPMLKEPILLHDAISMYKNTIVKLHADVDGKRVLELMPLFTQKGSLLVSVGPEGDLTSEERILLQQADFAFCRLTESVLKSEHACMLLWGIIRSCA